MSQMTKRALVASLKDLLAEKPLDKITVTDLTEHCGVNRMTFYYHFKDIYDLVEWACIESATRALAGMTVRPEDKEFIANFYKYAFVGLTLEWVRTGMKDDPAALVERVSVLIHGDITKSLETCRIDK